MTHITWYHGMTVHADGTIRYYTKEELMEKTYSVLNTHEFRDEPCGLQHRCRLPSDADYEVKSWPAFFSAMIEGKKKHDMRDKSERNYNIGDWGLLREYDPFGGGYSGRSAIFESTYITSNVTPCAMSSNALDRDACILSMERVSPVFGAE